MVEMRNAYKILVVKKGRKSHLHDLRVNGVIILEWKVGRCEWDASGSR